MRLLLTFGLTTVLAFAQERAPVEPKSLPAPDQPVEPVKPVIERLDATRYRIGELTFDQQSREIRFPAVVNMTEGLLEYALVRTHGKVHESLLTTDVSATFINLAFTLLRYQPSPELYALVNEHGGLSNRFPVVPAAIKAAARIQVKIEWQDHGKTRSVPLNELIQQDVKGTTMPESPWVYGGSLIEDGKFVAETTGDLLAIYITNAALVNYPGTDNDNDDVWIPYPKRVPPLGTKVTVVFAPNQGKKTEDKKTEDKKTEDKKTEDSRP